LPYAKPAMFATGFARPCRQGSQIAGETNPQRRPSARSRGLTGSNPPCPQPLVPGAAASTATRLANRDDVRSPLLVSRDGQTIHPIPNFGK
jgi:hypothetical protein